MDLAFYFGCVKESGHYLWNRHYQKLYECNEPDGFPCRQHILDGGLFPKRKTYTRDGEAFLAHINGWTIISFNDSTVDKRPGSHSVFVVRGIKTFEDALAEARKVFPAIFARFNFEIVPAQLETRLENAAPVATHSSPR